MADRTKPLPRKERILKGREFNNTNWISCINPDL